MKKLLELRRGWSGGTRPRWRAGKRTTVSTLLVLVGALAFGPGQALATDRVVAQDGLATPADCNAVVLTPYVTISSAEAASSDGDTIIVCPGFYNEQVFIDVDNLTILGAQAGVDARTRFLALESIINHECGPVQLAADNIVLDGFTIEGSTDSDPCFLSGIWSNPGFSGYDGGFQILNNIVQANISGIELDSTCVNPTLVRFNLIQNNSNPGPGSGNGIQTNFGLCNAQIDSNKFSGHTNSSFLVVVPSSNLDVTNNELVPGTPERFVFCCSSNATFILNDSFGSTAMNGTIRLFGGNDNIMIENNNLQNGVRGIRVDDPFAIGPNSDVVAHLNNIVNNSMAGLQVDAGGHTGTMNAECNWWGSASGPFPTGTGDAVIGDVDFIPWLDGPFEDPSSECIGAPGAHHRKWVVDDDLMQCPNADYMGPTGIDQASDSVATMPGDKIEVCEGNYTSVSVVKNDLKFKARGGLGAVKVTGDTLSNPPGNGFYVNADGVKITGFEIFGYSNWGVNLVFGSGDAKIKHNSVHTNMGGISVAGNHNKIEDNIVDANGFNDGIHVSTTMGPALDNTIKKNTVTNTAPGRGIFVGDDACLVVTSVANTKIEHNEVTGGMGNSNPVVVRGVSGAKLKDNYVHMNTAPNGGITIDCDSTGIEVEHNRSLSNVPFALLGGDGLWINDTHMLKVKHNRLTGNTGNGIDVSMTNGSVFDHNDARGNTGTDLVADGDTAAASTAHHNRCFESDPPGFWGCP